MTETLLVCVLRVGALTLIGINAVRFDKFFLHKEVWLIMLVLL